MRRLLCTLAAALFATGCSYLDEPWIPDQHGGPTRQVTVYEITGTDGDLHLDSAQIAVPATDNRATDAVKALLGHEPTGRGHHSLWAGMCQPADAVRSVRVTKTMVIVRLQDLAHPDADRALCDLTGEGWRMQKQQVAWTLRTATGSRAPVRVIVGAHYRWMPPTTASESALAPS